MIKRLFLALSALFLPLSLFAQTFSETDFERLIMKHPMMKNYDSKTGHFRNTSHQIRSKDELEAIAASITAELEKLKDDKAQTVDCIWGEVEDEEDFWGGIASLDARKKELQKKQYENNKLIEQDGVPGTNHLLPIINDMTNDLMIPLYNPNKVLLSKLPRYFCKPERTENGVRAFITKGNKKVLKEYLSQASAYAGLFPNSNRAVLVKNEGSNGDIAVVNLAIALAIHPKMSLFDTNRLGFYRISSLNLTEEEFQNEIDRLRDVPPIDNAQEKIMSDIAALRKKRNALSNLKVNATPERLAEAEKLRVSYVEEEKVLFSKLEDARYRDFNMDLMDYNSAKSFASEIESEVFEIINEVAKEKNIAIVFNNSTAPTKGYPETYDSRYIFHKGSATLSNLMYYSFLSLTGVNLEAGDLPLSNKVINWMEIMRYPGSIDVLPIRQRPLVLSKTVDILPEVVYRLYRRYARQISS